MRCFEVSLLNEEERESLHPWSPSSYSVTDPDPKFDWQDMQKRGKDGEENEKPHNSDKYNS